MPASWMEQHFLASAQGSEVPEIGPWRADPEAPAAEPEPAASEPEDKPAHEEDRDSVAGLSDALALGMLARAIGLPGLGADKPGRQYRLALQLTDAGSGDELVNLNVTGPGEVVYNAGMAALNPYDS